MRSRTLATALVALSLASIAQPASADGLDANKELVRRFAAAINAADWDAFDELLTPDFARHSQATPDVQVRSRDQFKAIQESFLETVPDQQVRLEMLVAEADKVAAYAVHSGTQTGAMGQIPPTGRSFESRFMSIFRIEDGRIAELWVEWDNLAILSQLGVFPPPAPTDD